MQEKKLNIKEAYLAMYRFLEIEYELTGSDDIGGLLGGMSFLEDGGTADPSVWENWIGAIKEIKRKDFSANLAIKPK